MKLVGSYRSWTRVDWTFTVYISPDMTPLYTVYGCQHSSTSQMASILRGVDPRARVGSCAETARPRDGPTQSTTSAKFPGAVPNQGSMHEVEVDRNMRRWAAPGGRGEGNRRDAFCGGWELSFRGLSRGRRRRTCSSRSPDRSSRRLCHE